MSIKSKCLAIDSSLYCRKFGAGMYLFYQVFKSEHCFSAPAQCEKEAWRLAYESLKKKSANEAWRLAYESLKKKSANE